MKRFCFVKDDAHNRNKWRSLTTVSTENRPTLPQCGDESVILYGCVLVMLIKHNDVASIILHVFVSHTSRFPSLFPPLDKNYVAWKIVNAVCLNQYFCIMPRMMYFFYFLKWSALNKLIHHNFYPSLSKNSNTLDRSSLIIRRIGGDSVHSFCFFVFNLLIL